MSFLSFALRCGQCRSTYALSPAPIRLFHGGQVLLARQAKKVAAPSKKMLAAKARRKAAKAKKSVYDSEKMTLEDAISVLRAVEVASPNSTYELVIKTEMKKGSVIPRGRFALPREPKPMSKDRVLVFAEGRQAEDAKKAGADIVGGPELADGVLSGRYNATVYLSTPGLLRAITPKLGRFLGPKGLMPSERRGTVTEDVAGYIRRLKGTAEWKGDKSGVIRTPIAKLHYPIEDVVKNVRYFLNVVKRATGVEKDPKEKTKKDAGSKPVNAITKVILSSRQGPGIQISDA
ncbi:ribosomal protein L1 [Panus rudis PR-1116 ss-1]|nr:ribosomal protein L1 [Panus rudis PR-1116 ss-1]